MTKTNSINHLSILATRYYFLSGVIETLGALIYLLMIPGDPKNAWMGGFSKTRLLMALVMLVVMLVFIGFSSLAWRNTRWANRVSLPIQTALNKFGSILPGMMLTYALVFCGGFLLFFLYLNNHNLTTRAGVLLRLSPFVILAFTRTVQFASTLFFLSSKLPKPETQGKEDPTILVKPQKITFILAGIALLLILLSVMVDVMELYTWELPMLGLRQKVDIDREANIPTFFSTVILLGAAFLLGIIAAIKWSRIEPYRYHWLLLSLVFLFFAMDETSVIHERLGESLKSTFNLQGIFYYGWVILGIILVFILGILYFKFLFDLPSAYKKLIIASLGLFFIGAIGTEMLTGWYTDHYHKSRAVDTMLTSIEEAFEMGGVILLIHTLLTYLKDMGPKIQLLFVTQPVQTDQDTQ